MRVIIRVIKRDTTDEEAIAMKKKVKEALKDYKDIEISMETL